MGITITANNSEYSFDMGYGSFFNLRKNIAFAYNEVLGEHYAKLILCCKASDYQESDRIANLIIESQRLTDDDIIDFLYQSDCEGKISYKTCGKIYELIKDIDFAGFRLVYANLSDGNDYEHFKAFLKECYSHRRNMFWR